MDPVVVNDEMNEKAKEMAVKLVKEVEEDFTIHDFRMIQGPTHTNLIFDVLVPYESELSDKEAADEIKKKIEAAPGNYFATIDIDRPFVKE